MSQIQIAFPTSDEVYLETDDILLEGDDLSLIADSDLIGRVARYLDRPDSDFVGMIVVPPYPRRIGINILIAPKPTFGGSDSDGHKNDYLYNRAMGAIRSLYEDNSVSQSVAKQNLNALIDEIQIMLDTLSDDEEIEA